MRIKQICMMVLLALGVAPWANAQTFDKWIRLNRKVCHKQLFS